MKNHHHNGPHSTAKNELHAAIATRAYELWLSRGKPENQSDEFWLEAEREHVTGHRSIQLDPAEPVSP